MESKFVRLDEIHAIGIGARTTNRLEFDQSSAKIPGLWNKFLAEGMAEKIPNQEEPARLMGIYTNYISDHTDEYELIIASAVTSLNDIPEGMSGVTILAGDYLVFQARGQMPNAVIQTWKGIWDYFAEDSSYERLYTTDFELYRGDSEADIHIAVKKRNQPL